VGESEGGSDPGAVAQLPEGWDQRSRWTQRFIDPGLEAAYQAADRESGVRRARTASLVAAVVWIVVAAIGPPALGIDPGPVWLVAGTMVVFLLACAVASRWATTPGRRDLIGIGQQVAAAVAILVLTVITGAFAAYAMPGMMLTAVFGFAVTRPPYVGSLALGVFYCIAFLVTAIAVHLGEPTVLQFALVTATVVAASVGAFLLERSQRAAFSQGRLVATLHRRVDRLLHQYLSPDLANTLIDQPDLAALGGEVVEVTVLFADLRGYTAYAEGRTPADVVEMLNAAFGATVPIVLGEGGTVVQFMGDALMAIFNAPRRQSDHALRAARAALAMQRAIVNLRATEPGSPDASPPGFRIGLNTGPALVGNVGAAEIRNYAAIGDTTNVAARLQTFAPEGSIVIGATTFALIRERAVTRALGAPELKGKSVAVEAYELLDLR
jgi:class 3 adenylate cyclase